MTIYRAPRRRWTVAVAAGLAGLLVGLVAGWLLRPGLDPVDAIADVRSALVDAADILEVLDIEYAEAVFDGKVVSSPEYEGARAALGSSRDTYLEARPALAAMSAADAVDIDAAYTGLERLVGQVAPVGEVSVAVDELRTALTTAVGG